MKKSFKIGNIPALLYGEKTDRLFIYIHGKMGCKEDTEEFACLAAKKGWQVLSVDLLGHGERKAEADSFVPWKVIPELRSVVEYAKGISDELALYAVSIGAWFSMEAFADEPFSRALFVSPVLDMNVLIGDMMKWASVTEGELEKRRYIETDFGETLDWEYFLFARNNPITQWKTPTAILYADGDKLTRRDTVDNFVQAFGCSLQVIPNCEHWIHTEEQLAVLRAWEERSV